MSDSPRSPKTTPSATRARSARRHPEQLELPIGPRQPSQESARAGQLRGPSPKASLRVIPGGGQRTFEPLTSRDAVIRVLVEAGADMLLRRISVERAEEIQDNVDRILELFDRVDLAPELLPTLQRELDELEALMRETRSIRGRRHRVP